ncbi:EndoS/ChiA family endoglycosidase [Corynebacterium diphtheriae]|uniref:EndoS/ChiA family endoglycosidase n=1 Tax=Corynebacterium diphtheriae TaxID=1717 RepID=UPI00406BB284
MRAVAELVDYVLPQTYKSGGAEIDQLWNASRNTLSSCQFVPGYAHPEEGDTVNRFETAIGDVDSSKAMEVAAWQPAGGEKGGAFVYAIDRDGRTYGEDDLNNVKETDFSFTKRGVALARPVAFSKAQDLGSDRRCTTSSTEVLLWRSVRKALLCRYRSRIRSSCGG